ncbi:MAG TPA: EamA family transporter [Solirubrobacteraceae bacterium]|nr:EamA family transporter [Solirubrobacteraceae bacterium]
MNWLAYALATVVLWTAWSFLGVIALKEVSAAHATLVFGVAVVVVGVASLALGNRGGPWSPSGLGVAAISGGCGALGMATFYLALSHGKASSVVPVIGVYPAFVALLAVALLSESLSAAQTVGVFLAVIGVVLVGTGG